MVRTLLSILLAAVAGLAQTQPQAQPKPQDTQPQSSTHPAQSSAPKPAGTGPAAENAAPAVPPTEAVITMHGVCNNSGPAKTPAAANPASCTTVVTRAQFEKLLDALNSSNQPLPPNMRRNLAQAYVELSAYAQAANKAGTDNDPKFLEVMRLVRLRTLSDMYRRSLEEKFRNPPAQDIQTYYNANTPKFEEIKLSRIFIPAKNPSSQNKDDWEKKASQTANDLRERAAKGEDLEKLQKEAYTTLGLTVTPPNTIVGVRRRGMLLPAEEKELFALNPGEVSKVEQQAAAYVIYKLESKQLLPLEQVKDEISRELFREKMDAQLKGVTEAVHADLNDQYFGPANPPPSHMGPGGTPGALPQPPTPRPAPTTPPQGQAPPK